MENKILPNFGYITDILPKDLYNSLITECDDAEVKNPEMISNLTDTDVAKHYFIVNNKLNLFNYIQSILDKYLNYYPKSADIRVATDDLPFHFDKPWINYQRQGQYVPNHNHDGIYSYSIWLKIPKKCIFEFTYTNIVGNIEQLKIKLTKEDEGKIIFFPAKLPHIAYPFNDSNEVRLSISGNISLRS